MRINSDAVKVQNIYNNRLNIEKNKDTTNKNSDEVCISKLGKELAKYSAIANKTDIQNDKADNLDKVDKIKQAINDNNYKVDDEKLTNSIYNFIKGLDL